ncbi:MAG: hypothetical protein M1821_008146 [Bathelium mastoideum]|nr:MAG: hypothetical protein M1821_008146 [Bathelium mastoideum]
MPTITYPVVEGDAWATRTMEVDRLTDHDQDNRALHLDNMDDLPRTPKLGLLSRTVVRSTIINQILPAKLRHEKHNDVVYIGEDSIHVKEVLETGKITHIASKTDFGARIWASRVLGQVSPPPDATNKNWANQVFSDEESKNGIPIPSDPMDLDVTEQPMPPQLLALTLETQQLVFIFLRQSSNGAHEFRQATIPLPTSQDYLETLGRHLAVDPRTKAIAVGALEGSFALLHIKPMSQIQEDARKGVRAWRPIESQQIHKVNGVILKMDFLHTGSLDDERVILVLVVARQGRILIHSYAWNLRDWLGQPPEESRIEKISDAKYQSPLLLIPIHNRPDFLLICEHGSLIYTSVLGANGSIDSIQISEQDPRHPGSSKRAPLWTSWTRPLRRYHDFFERETARKYNRDDTDFVYLLREDGAVEFLILSGTDRQNLNLGTAASYNGHFNSAFAFLQLTYRDPDILIAAGSGSNGCVKTRVNVPFGKLPYRYLRPDSFEGDELTLLRNWSPMRDFTIPAIRSLRGGVAEARSSVFVASGRQPHGTVAELRSGYETSMIGHLVFEAEQDALDIPTGVWPLFNLAEQGLVVLFSYPNHAQIYLIPPKNVQAPATDRMDKISLWANFDQVTIWVGSLFGRDFLHVTRERVLAFDLNLESSTVNEIDIGIVPSGHVILAAAFNSHLRTMVIASYAEHQYSLEVWMFVDGIATSKKMDAVLVIPAEPTCITTHNVNEALVVAIGASNGTLLLCHWEENGGFGNLLTYPLSQLKTGRSMEPDLDLEIGLSSGTIGSVCESVLIVSPTGDEAQGLVFNILCGLRDGTLCSIPITHLDAFRNRPSGERSKTNIVNRIRATSFSMGPTAVKLTPGDGDRSSTALAYNDSSLCIVSVDPNDCDRLNIETMLLKYRDGKPLPLGSIAACARVPRNGGFLSNELSGSLFCFSGHVCYVQEIDDDERKTVPWQIPLQSTPERLLFCDWLRLIVVAGTRNSSKEASSKTSGGRASSMQRATRGVLEFVKPGASFSDPENSRNSYASRALKYEDQPYGYFELQKGERIFALTQWTHQRDRGSKHGLILVGSGKSDPKSPRTGRLLFIEATEGSSGHIDCKIKKQILQTGPVRCVTVFQRNHFVCGVGNLLRMYRYEEQEKKIWRVGETELSSPLIYITTDSSFIHVSTVGESASILHVAFENGVPKFTTVALDHLARNGATHLPIQVHLPDIMQPANFAAAQDELRLGHDVNENDVMISLLLASDQANNLVGFHQRCAIRKPPNDNNLDRGGELIRPSSNAAPIIFTANLPRSITRLHRSSDLRAPFKPRSTDLPGALENDIIGSATDGTIMNFTILSEAGYNVFRFISDLYMEHDRKKKYTETGVRWDCDRSSEMDEGIGSRMMRALGQSGPAVGAQREGDRDKRTHHIDGDFLLPMVEAGGIELLRSIMSDIGDSGRMEQELETNLESGIPVEDAPNERTPAFSHQSSGPMQGRARYSDRPDQRIRELAELVKKLIQEDGVSESRRWDGDLVTVTMRYLKDVLEPII